jgi:hypothetical protein
MTSSDRDSIDGMGRSERPRSTISTATTYFDKRASAESNITLKSLTLGRRDVHSPESTVHPFFNSNVQRPPDADQGKISMDSCRTATPTLSGTTTTANGTSIPGFEKDDDVKPQASVEITALADFERALGIFPH